LGVKMGNSFLLIIVGLLIFYLIISDKWKCFEGFLACLANKTESTSDSQIKPIPKISDNITKHSGLELPDFNILHYNGF